MVRELSLVHVGGPQPWHPYPLARPSLRPGTPTPGRPFAQTWQMCSGRPSGAERGVWGGAWQGRADWPTGLVTGGARARVGQQDRPCYSAQSAQELAVAESITACGWCRGQGSLPLEG